MDYTNAVSEINKILDLYQQEKDENQVFVPGKSIVQYAGNIYAVEEMKAAVEVLLKGWLGLAEKGVRLEEQLSALVGKPYGVLTNSGSSANLLAMATLKSHKFRRKLMDGDEVITPASGFPTTINPIIQTGMVPVFVDVTIGDYNLDVEQLEDALSPKTKALIFAHTLGNPGDLERIVEFCDRHELVLIEDCCDALGSTYDDRPVGSFGDFSTLSMYPSHHITIGEGGFVAARSVQDGDIVRSLRDWGRDCWCAGQASLLEHGSCGKRFDKWLTGIDEDIDHKYVYGEIGYNLKPIELQAAMGIVQVKRLEGFISKRKDNFKHYYRFMEQYEEYFYLPTWSPKADPSWFAFPLTVKKTAPFKKSDIVKFLEKNKIQTRNLFAGNILRHPAYQTINHRIVGNLNQSDIIITDTFFIGLYPGITPEMRHYVCEKITEFIRQY